MRKTEGFSVRYFRLRLVVLIACAFPLLMTGCFSKPAAVPDPGQAKSVESILTVRQTSEGVVIGTINEAANTLSWKAIPYAQPPVGELRWRAPRNPAKRTAPLQADKFCEICPQYIDHDRNPATPQVVMGNENCLYLNIWAPKTQAANLPVFVWIHGGGNSIQWPLLSSTDGAILAGKANMIVVTLNYRLGPMGFFNYPALRSGDEAGDSGNFAILDLIAALTWIKTNIKAFGGDAGNVTIAGESAGGQNVFCLLSSPLAKGLFHRAIAESGVIRPSTPAQGEAHVNGIIAKLLVKDGKAADERVAAAQLTTMSAKEIEGYLRSKKAQDFLEMYPEGKIMGMIRFPSSFSDGTVLPKDFYGALESGNYNKVPVITGTNKEEAKLFLRGFPPFASWRQDQSLLQDPAKMEFYDLAAKYQSDGWKVMAVDNVARILRDNMDQPMVFAYQFLWGAGGAKGNVLEPPFNIVLGACHAMEIDFVFGTQNASLGAAVFNEKNRSGRTVLSNAMMDYWAQFARTGNPNRDQSGLPKWSPWSNIEGFPKTILLDADLEKYKITMSRQELTNEDIENALKAEPRQKEIQPFWDASPYKRR
jgi:para-nitrobenzyl esterase